MVEWKEINRDLVETIIETKVERNPETRKNEIVKYQIDRFKVTEVSEDAKLSKETREYVRLVQQRYPFTKLIITKNGKYMFHDGKIRGYLTPTYTKTTKQRSREIKEEFEVERHEQQKLAVIDSKITVYLGGKWTDETTAKFTVPVRMKWIEGKEKEAAAAAIEKAQQTILNAKGGFERIYKFEDERVAGV